MIGAELASSFALIWRYAPSFAAATLAVLQISVLCILVSWVCGMLAALAQTAPSAWLRYPAKGYVWFIRGTPTLIQIFIVYFGMPQLGLRLSPFVAGVIALGVSSGAYVAEIVRGGLLAVPKGQIESAAALGLSRLQRLRLVVMPQVLRVVLPPITNEATTTLKNTSLLSTITVLELTLQARITIATTFRPFEFYIFVALIYLAMTSLMMWLSSHLEDRMDKKYTGAR